MGANSLQHGHSLRNGQWKFPALEPQAIPDKRSLTVLKAIIVLRVFCGTSSVIVISTPLLFPDTFHWITSSAQAGLSEQYVNCCVAQINKNQELCYNIYVLSVKRSAQVAAVEVLDPDAAGRSQHGLLLVIGAAGHVGLLIRSSHQCRTPYPGHHV
jgi:hypothetical protein